MKLQRRRSKVRRVVVYTYRIMIITVKHILIECIDTADIRRQYFNCVDLKTLFNSVAGDTILAFLSDIYLIDKI